MIKEVSSKSFGGKWQHSHWKCGNCDGKLGFLWPELQGVAFEHCPFCGAGLGKKRLPKHGYKRYKTKG